MRQNLERCQFVLTYGLDYRKNGMAMMGHGMALLSLQTLSAKQVTGPHS
jgi:hypothetical protein